jgi:dynein heavy chain
LRDVAAAADDLRRVPFCAAAQGRVYALQEYADAQTAQREARAKPAVDAAVERVQQV